MNGITLGVLRLSLDERRKVKGTAYAGGVLSYYGDHIAIDLDSLQFSGKQIPLLHNHDRDRCVGYGWLAREGKALTVHGEMLSNDHAAEIIKAADDGLEWQMSVHIEAGRVLTRHAGDMVNGEALAVDDVLVMTDGVIREVSFTPTGVDADTSASILSLSLTKEIPMNKPDNTPDERDARIANIEQLLASWGSWSRQDVLPKAARNSMAFITEYNTANPQYFAQVLFEQTNTAMLILKQRHKRIYQVLESRYLYNNYDDKDVGRRIGISEQTVRVWRNQGHMFIDGRLADKFPVKEANIA